MIDRQAQLRGVRRVLLVTLLLNLLVAAGEGAYGLYVGSLAMMSNAIHSLVDASANAVGLLILGAAAKPPDKRHPYGHRKFEAMGGLFLGVAVGGTALRFGWDAVSGLLSGAPPPDTSVGGFYVLGASMLINVFVAAYEAHRARTLESSYLTADAAHTLSDVLVSATVFVSFAAAHQGIAWADPAAALLVIGALMWIAYRVLRSHLTTLTDVAVLDPDDVRRVALTLPGVGHVHRIRSRGQPEIHLDLHLGVDNELSLRAAHDLGHRVEAALRQEWPDLADVLIHVEPEEDAPEDL
jgi:cation diffusion facilitator family transporter